jgi:dihydroflavonol-4-reductase
MRIAITGGTGFIGQRIVQQLLDAGNEVVVVARRPDAAKKLLPSGAQVAAGDILDKRSLVDAFQGADAVIHNAAAYEMQRRKRAAMDANVAGTRNALEAIGELGTKRAVYVSSIIVTGYSKGKTLDETQIVRRDDFLSYYEMTKYRAHVDVFEPLAKQGLPVVAAMPGAVFGPGDHSTIANLLESYVNRLPVVSPNTMSTIHVDDAARGIIACLERGKPGEAYHLCLPPSRMTEFLDACARVCGVPRSRFVMPGWLFKLNAAFMTLVEWAIPVPQMFAADTLRLAAGTWLGADNKKATRELGFTPRSLDESLPDTLADVFVRAKKPVPEQLAKLLPAPRAASAA